MRIFTWLCNKDKGRFLLIVNNIDKELLTAMMLDDKLWLAHLHFASPPALVLHPLDDLVLAQFFCCFSFVTVHNV